MEKNLAEDLLRNLSKEDLIRFILKRIYPGQEEKIPITIFTTKLSPLESITRYLKERDKRTKEISALLNKPPSSVSKAYKTSRAKQFRIKNTETLIPLSQFQNSKRLSIMEIIVSYLKSQDLKLTQIASLLKRNPKTVWTINQRAKKKIHAKDVYSKTK